MHIAIQRILPSVIAVSLIFSAASARSDDQKQPPATFPSDPFVLYARAEQAIVAWSPSSTGLVYPDDPPYGPEWDRLAQDAWNKNGPARELTHQAGLLNTTSLAPPSNYLNDCRAVANDLGDAALYQHFHANDAGAGRTILDLFQMARLLRQEPTPEIGARILTAIGIEGKAIGGISVISSSGTLTSDQANTTDLQVKSAHELIAALMDQPTVRSEFEAVQHLPPQAPDRPLSTNDEFSRTFLEVLNFAAAERNLAAMSLACQVFHFENHRWPANLDELVPACLPHVVVDPCGDGRQPLGYVLIKSALPDGSDRPMVYSHFGGGDFYFRADRPVYHTTPPLNANPHGGEFRDVTHWVPSPNANPTTRPLD